MVLTRKFTEVLEEYLEERERQRGDYYDNRYLGAKIAGRMRLEELADELNVMFEEISS